MSKDNFQYKENTDRKQFIDKSEGRVCLSCSCVNDSDSFFCQECGIKFEGSGKPCPVCGEFNSGVYCSFCGSNTEGFTCSSCKTLQYTDFCAQCGEPLTAMAREFVSESPSPSAVTEMSRQDALVIISELNNSLSLQMQKEQEKKRQRIILLRESEYFNEREKRIDEYKSSQVSGVRVIKREEMEIIKKTIQRLRGFVAKEHQRIDEEIKILAENERLEVERKDRERYNSRADGIWINTSGRISIIMRISVNGLNASGTMHLIEDTCVERVDSFTGKWDYTSITINSVSMNTIWKKSGWYNTPIKFSATVNPIGNQMNGFIRSEASWNEIFIKQE